MYLIPLLIIAIGIILFIILISVYKRKSWAIKHYEELRDELSKRDDIPDEILEDDDEVEISSIGKIVIQIILITVPLLCGITIFPIISNPAISYGSNVTGVASTILDLTPLIFIIGVLAAGISLISGGLRNAGMYESKTEKLREKASKIGNKAKGIVHYEKNRDKITKRK